MAGETDKEMLSKVLEDLQMTEEELENGVKHLREWLSKQPHLPVDPSDTELKAFIVGSKSIERAKQKLDAFYTARGKPFLSENRDPTNLEWDNLWMGCHLPGLSPEGWKVLFFSMSPKGKRKYFNCDHSCHLLSMQLERLMRDEFISTGHLVVADCTNFTSDVFKDLSILSISNILSLYQNVFPIRIRGIIFFNCTSILEPIINNIFKPLLSKKIKDKFFVYSDMSSLSKHISLDFLPSDYNGKGPSWEEIKNTNIKDLKAEREWFMTKGSEKSNEDLRPPSDSTEFGVQGTFRKLNID